MRIEVRAQPPTRRELRGIASAARIAPGDTIGTLTITELSRASREAQEARENQVERALVDITNDICRIMEEQGVSRAGLSRRLGHSPGWASGILRGGGMSLKALVGIFWELGYGWQAGRGLDIYMEQPVGSPASLTASESHPGATGGHSGEEGEG